MRVLVTGSKGFIGKNLIATLKQMPNIEILEFDKGKSAEELKELLKKADFIYHLAGVNRPKETKEFYEGNSNLTKSITNFLISQNRAIPILFSSSSQVGNGSDYAKSKELAEEILKDYAKKMNIDIFVYRLPNVFGKWSKPNYNSVIATWCYNIARDLPIRVDNEMTILNLAYIDDVVSAFVNHLYRSVDKKIYYEIERVYKKSLKEIRDMLISFKKSRENLIIPHIAKGFTRALYATYLSFLPKDKFSYKLSGHKDNRGTFYEIIKTLDSGQLGLSTTKPNIIRGNHFHNTKNEKFIVVKGKALIQMRDIFSKEVIRFEVSSDELEVVEMIPGYTHNIKNIGDEEMVLLIWANENFDPNNPDTFYEEVISDSDSGE